MGFDPVEKSKVVENIVMRNGARSYYRFRFSLHYGGIVTADAVGCNLLCAYCWNYRRNENPKATEFYTPKQAAEKLLSIAKRNKCKLFRISGAEPILGEESTMHVAKLIDLVGGTFILETNGIMLGYEPGLVDRLKDLNVLVRMNVKGWDEESFEKVTGADGRFFEYQLEALRHLEGKVRYWVAVMYEIFKEEGIERLKKILPVRCRIEVEYLNTYPFVVENMKKRGFNVQQ
ncbi:radical SAM protein [Thermotoga sp. Ku-13t]|uniref:radical SAM protein n=1 Tax=Thermotoga sp. Ku-13t TaxID=1755813 RepID=UPI0013EB67B5|nr:radical SAM protein [Thermotoga sp. Ku-13t]KAF2958993.1 radical SAM protein [Thermotoga sp. Ku-13t]